MDLPLYRARQRPYVPRRYQHAKDDEGFHSKFILDAKGDEGIHFGLLIASEGKGDGSTTV